MYSIAARRLLRSVRETAPGVCQPLPPTEQFFQVHDRIGAEKIWHWAVADTITVAAHEQRWIGPCEGSLARPAPRSGVSSEGRPGMPRPALGNCRGSTGTVSNV